MSAVALRERLASLGARPSAPRTEVSRRPPNGFEAVPTPFGTGWRWIDMEPIGRLPGAVPTPDHAYLDTEATGLAGGTGTQVFAAAVCVPTPSGLRVVQLFTPEPSGEPALLHLLSQELEAVEAVATYNGGSFDLPLLRTRWIMARMAGEFRHPPHVDLLPMTRALFRQRLDCCTLHAVEERLLGVEREVDLPGHLVPQAYFEYLRRGWSPLLEPALAHNRQDVRSLLYLHARLLRRSQGQDADMAGADWLALGRHLLRRGRRADGWRALRNAVRVADGPAAGLAAILLARGLTRRRRYEAAERLLAEAQRIAPDQPPVAIARAKLLEWRLGDIEVAQRIVADELRALPADSGHRYDLERRLARLTMRQRRRRTPIPA